MKIRVLYFLLINIILFTSVMAQLQRSPNEPPQKTRILFLLDGSGSMLANWEGNTRMNIAKDLLTDLVDSLRDHKKLELALRAYGHQSPKKYNNCEDTKLEVPFGPNNHDDIIKKLAGIDPKGVTPLAHSLLQAGNDFPREDNVRNVIIIITDGLESCKGEPCRISKVLQAKHIFLKPFIIGIGMNENFTAEFDCMGQFFNADNVKTFDRVLGQIIQQALSEAKIRVDLLDIYGDATETNVNMSFVNNVTDVVEFEYVHLIKNGKSDYVDIDPVLSYDIRVNTIPSVTKKNIFIEGGRENVIEIKTPQGELEINQSGHLEYGNLKALIHEKGTGKLLNIQDVGSSQKYLVGKYDVEVLTLPVSHFKNVAIDQSETTKLSLPSPGILNIIDSKIGFGSLYELNEKGQQRWIYDITGNSHVKIPMQPGKYKIVFRSRDAISTSFTYVKEFEIREGGTTSIKLFSK